MRDADVHMGLHLHLEPYLYFKNEGQLSTVKNQDVSSSVGYTYSVLYTSFTASHEKRGSWSLYVSS